MKHLVIIALIGIATFLISKVTIQPTDSMTHTFYFKSSEAPTRNDAVEFQFHHPFVMDNKEISLTKRLACMPGDSLVIDNGMIFCNHKIISTGGDMRIGGHVLPTITFDGVIPSDKAFVLGDSLDSFDSRYWGFTQYKNLHKLTPLFNW